MPNDETEEWCAAFGHWLEGWNAAHHNQRQSIRDGMT